MMLKVWRRSEKQKSKVESIKKQANKRSRQRDAQVFIRPHTSYMRRRDETRPWLADGQENARYIAVASVISADCNESCAADGMVKLTKIQVHIMYCKCCWMQFPRLSRAQLPTKATDEVPKHQGRLGRRDSACAAAALQLWRQLKKGARQVGGLVTSEWGLQPGQPSASAPP